MNLGETEDKTAFIERPAESRVFNVSVRGWLAILIIGSACLNAVATYLACISIMIWSGSSSAFEIKHLTDVDRNIHDLALIAIGYYFSKQEEHLARNRRQPEPPKTP
jgi:hypothetical protein